MEMRCCPMSLTISWSVWDMRRPGGRSPFCGAFPLRWGCASPLAGGWGGGAGGCCIAAGCGGGGGGDSLRVRLRGGRWPAPSSPESVEARLARDEPRRPRRELTRAPAASAEPEHPRDVTAHHHLDASVNHLPLFSWSRRSALVRSGSSR
ncbi:hypothetical protein O0L34_g2003 [Tuta absoluta]|nr:hypothetical protein O0L34_g2003 [Tuta absoluta]